MAIVPFQPNSNWNWKDAKYKFVSFILIGVLASFFALLFIYPILSINLVTDTGSQLGKYAKQVVDVSCGGTMEALNMVGSVVNGLGGGMVTTITELTAQTVMAVEFISDIIQSMSDLIGPMQSLLTGSVKDIMSAVSMASEYLSGILGKTMNLATESVGGVVTNILPLLGSIQEAMSFIITNGFTTAIQTFNGIRGMLADKIEAFSKSELPRLINAFSILQSVSQGQIFGDSSIAIVTLTVALYVKSFKRVTGIFTDSSIISDLISSTVSAIGSITADLSGLSIDFCEVLVGIIEPLFSLLNIPGTGDLNNCALDFVRLGLWYITNGSFCQTTPGSAIVTNFTNCLLGEIAYVTLIPGYTIEVSASKIFDLIGDTDVDLWPSELFDPLLSGFKSLLNGLPSVSFGWTDISLDTIFSNVGNVLVDIFTGFKSIFSSKVVALLPKSPAQTLLPLVLIYTIFKLVEKLLASILPILTSTMNSAFAVFNQWDVCTPEIGLYLPDWCSYTVLSITFYYICFTWYGASWCVSDIIGGYSKIVGAAMTQIITPITSSLFNISALISNILGSIPGAPASGAFLAQIDQKILDGLNNLNLFSSGDLPFFFNV